MSEFIYTYLWSKYLKEIFEFIVFNKWFETLYSAFQKPTALFNFLDHNCRAYIPLLFT